MFQVRSGWSTRRRVRGLAVAATIGLLAAGCGGDDSATDDDPQPSVASSDAAGPTSGAPAPQAGGDATILLYSEQATMDPVRFTGSGSTDAQRAFAVYAALVGADPATGEVQPILAESLQPNADFTVWTLVLRPDLVFSDGSPFDAAAVKANWERIDDPANSSPALALGASIEALDVVDAVTLQITLVAPNAHFDNGVSRQGHNYIASAEAIAAGHDLGSAPIGAGPFVLDSWVRDDRMELSRNPDWFGPAGLDHLTFRVVTDESQRTDTFLTGDADVMFATDATSIEQAIDGSDGESVITRMATGQTISFNTSRPPFDDVRVRRAVSMGIDRAVMAESVEGAGVEVATHFSVEGTQWFVPEGQIPAYDPDEAQRLLSEYAAETGGPVRFTLSATQTNRNQGIAGFIQTAFDQMDDVEVEIRTGDFPSFVGWALQADYDATIWGYPTVDPDPGLYNAVHSGLGTNVSRYVNPDVDAALDAARSTADVEARLGYYRTVNEHLAADLPFLPVTNTTHAFIASDAITGLQVYEDGVLRVDLLSRAS